MLEIRLLGEQRVLGGPLSGPGQSSSRSFALLAYLILHSGIPQGRGHLAATFWPDSNEAQARTNLRRELHNLRIMLAEDPSLDVQAATLTWIDSPSCRVDVRFFETERRAALSAQSTGDTAGFLAHAEAAIGEYRGDLMPGSYEEWVLDEREPLLRACADLCDDTARVLRAAGDRRRASQFADRRIRLKPLEEVGYRVLMELQSEAGDRAAALNTYHRCAMLLERELGVSPDPATTLFIDRLLDREAAPARPDALIVARVEHKERAIGGLVGRGKELDLMFRHWQQAREGQSGLVVVSGDAGVGKTRLVADLAATARAEGSVVATTRCFGQSGALALSPVADWLRSDELRSAAGLLEPVWQIEVDRLVPRLDSPPSGNASHADPSANRDNSGMVDAWQRHRFFEGISRAFLAVDRPMLLVLDDIQWCDPETMAWLVFLFGFIEDRRLLVAATVRSGEVEDNRAVTTSLKALHSAGVVTDVKLAPFDAATTAELAGSLAGRTLTVQEEDLVYAATSGYPLFITEAARDLTGFPAAARSSQDSDLRGLLDRRLEQLSSAAKDVAGLAAAVGRDFSLDLLNEASDLDAGTLVRSVDELWRHRILVEQRSGYDFSHDLLRDAAYTAVSPPRRWLLHRRLAQGIELLHAGHIDDVAAQLAEQYDRGGRQDRALIYFRQAAEVAEAVFANAEATRYYRRCLSLVAEMPAGLDRDTHELDLLELVSAPLNALYGYASPVLQSTLERSAALAESLERPSLLARILVGLFTVQIVQGHIALAHQTAGRVLQLAETEPGLAGQAHFGFAGSASSLGLLDVASNHFDMARELSPGPVSFILGTHHEVHCQAWAAHTQWLLGDEQGSLSRCADAVDRGRLANHPYSLAVALAYAGITHQLCADEDGMLRSIAELRDLCARYEFAYYGEWTFILEGWAIGGPDGIDLIRGGIDRLRSQGAYIRMPYWLSLLADTLIGDRREDEARAVLDAALVAAEQRDDRWWLPEIMRLRAGLESGAAGREILDRAIEIASGQSSRTLELRCRADAERRSVRPSMQSPTRGANAVRTPRS
jgi:DNA-binding SARP family transcriptional activator